jgi:hypothetical protein
MKFKNFLINVNSEEFDEQEAPPADPAAPAGAAAAPPAMPMATPPMATPPMGGGLDAGLGAPPASPGAQAPPIKIKTSNVWDVLKGLLSEKPEDQSTLNSQDVLKNGDKPKHLMGI